MERAHADSDVAPLPFGSLKIYFRASRYSRAALRARQPEVRVDFLYQSPAQSREPVPENLFSRAIQQKYSALQVRRQQPATHGMHDVFGEVLQVQQLFTFLFQFRTFSAQGLRQKASQIRNGQKTKQIAQKPDA